MKEKNVIENITKLLKEQNKQKKDLCEELGVSPSNFGNWLSGRNTSYMKYIYQIANYFNVSVAYLLGQTEERTEKTPPDERESNAIILDNDKIRMIPLFESVSAGFGTYPDEQIVDYIPLYISSPNEARETLCITVKGDSMYPKIENGDIIQVHKQDYADNGRIAVALIDGDEAVVKKITYGTNWIELHSINPEYKTRRFEGQDVLRVQILGQVKKIIKSV